MNERRTLIVHAGGDKAGSTALQSALRAAADCLAKAGISYAGAPTTSSPYDMQYGNGMSLYEKIARPEWQDEIGSLLESFLGEHQLGICSSEYLGSMAEVFWRRIIEAANDHGIDLKIVYFVRSPVGYVAAWYNQQVKGGAESRTIEDAAPDAHWRHFDDLKKLDRLFDEDHVRVINYDLIRSDILAAFSASWPELTPSATCLAGLAKITVNRSLSRAEMDVMRVVSAKLGVSLGREISDRLIAENPELKTRLFMPSEIADILQGKFSNAVKWINSRFFADSSAPLRHCAGVSIGEAEDTDDPERVLLVVLEWALDRIAGERKDVSFVRRRLLEIDWHHANDPVIPADFDPIAYLIVNEDLLRSQTQPYEHYITNGHREDRQYRWPVQLDAAQDASIAQAIARLRLDDPQEWVDTPIWPRLRHFLQLEALLHEFADREREYLEQSRRLVESQGYEGEQFSRALAAAFHPIAEELHGSRADADQAIAELSARLSQLEAQQLNGMQTLLETLSHQVRVEASALREDHAALTGLITRKDEELASQRQLIDRYRESGIIQRVKWLFRPSALP